MPTPITRLAPSPTGTLHLGNACTFLANWALARQIGWRIVLRIEDLDRSRVRSDSDQQIIHALKWLGIDWDEGPLWQSHDLEPYRTALQFLCENRMAYACPLTRKQILDAASAPHDHAGEVRFPLQLRSTRIEDYQFRSNQANYRLVVHDERIEINDQFCGNVVHDPFHECGDFIIWTKLGVPAYQLAVVVDDARQGVTDVVRGNDLLPSAARQTLLYNALKKSVPRWWHLPLVTNEHGRRLAKRDGDTHLQMLQERNVPADRVRGLIAKWCGIVDRHEEVSAAEFLQKFTIDAIPRASIPLTIEDRQWLLR